ncbi:MAG: PDZ domain-containing protein [Firmicutes bacterium]|nr:PDZ domain-containing protein [Bacillota bacterium]
MPGTKRKSKLTLLLVVVGLFIAGYFIRTDHLLVMPGSAQDLREMVAVENGDGDDRGKFYLVTVAQRQTNLWSLIYGSLHPDIEVQRLSSVIPRGMQEQEYHELLGQLMAESKNTARVIALRRAGYDVEIVSEGVVVAGFLDQSPSRGILEKGDLITAIDGRKTHLAGEVISTVQQRRVGDTVKLTVMRDSSRIELAVTTAAHPDDPALPALGVYISTLEWKPVLPLKIDLETGEIAGPSAGLMFVLEILNQLQPGDLTGGHLVAGTGTIDINEQVGPIGGVFQKVIAAEKAGAEYFFVPVENYEEARKAVRRITLVPVKTLQEALEHLEALPLSGRKEATPDRGESAARNPAA